MTIQYNTPSLLSHFHSFSSLRVALKPSADLRQFAKQEALQHTAIPAHLDEADKHTLMRPNVHPRTCTHTHTHNFSSSASTGTSQQDIRPLKIMSDMWHEWLITSVSEHSAASVCTKFEQLLAQLQRMLT